MPDGYRTGRFGTVGRALFALIAAVALLLVAISVYVWATQAVTPERGSAGAVGENSRGRTPPSHVRSRPQR
ncbi:MAG: hypothetical protein PGN09_09625 [Sphingomonas fennica]